MKSEKYKKGNIKREELEQLSDSIEKESAEFYSKTSSPATDQIFKALETEFQSLAKIYEKKMPKIESILARGKGLFTQQAQAVKEYNEAQIKDKLFCSNPLKAITFIYECLRVRKILKNKLDEVARLEAELLAAQKEFIKENKFIEIIQHVNGLSDRYNRSIEIYSQALKE